jgi:predicted dehydrogenase
VILDRVRVESSTPSVAIDDRPLRLAIFGAGKAARFHLEAISHLRDVSLAGVCSRSGTTAEALVAGHPGALATAERSGLVDPDRVDAAIVAVSPDQSEEVAGELLDAGIPILAEKPAALSSDAVLALGHRAEATGTLALVAVNRRYYSLVGQALAAVRERGPVRGVLVEGHEPTDLLLRGGGDARQIADWFFLNSVHHVDLLRLAGGDVAEVVGLSSATKVPLGDHFSATMRFVGGGLGTYVAHWNSAAPPMLRLYGDDVSAEVRLSPPEHGFVEVTGKRRMKLRSDDADSVAKPGVLEQDAAFLAAVAAGSTSAPSPASDLADHAATLRLVERLRA